MRLKRYLFSEKKGIILNYKRYHFGTTGIIFADFDLKRYLPKAKSDLLSIKKVSLSSKKKGCFKLKDIILNLKRYLLAEKKVSF